MREFDFKASASKLLTNDIVNMLGYRVEDIMQILDIGRNSAYNLVKENHFKVVRIGTAIRISRKSFDEWLESHV